jgi:hypothetical protein
MCRRVGVSLFDPGFKVGGRSLRQTIEHRAAPYDLTGVIQDLAKQRHPSAHWLAGKMDPRH